MSQHNPHSQPTHKPNQQSWEFTAYPAPANQPSEPARDSEQYEALCLDIALVMRMYPEFVSLLHHAAGTAHVGVVWSPVAHVVFGTWIIERAGLSDKAKIIGKDRLSDGFVVAPAVKAALVSHLQEVHGLYVWAFGGSPLDLPMLRKADQSIVVVVCSLGVRCGC